MQRTQKVIVSTTLLLTLLIAVAAVGLPSPI
jgi:hypothetical protein